MKGLAIFILTAFSTNTTLQQSRDEIKQIPFFKTIAPIQLETDEPKNGMTYVVTGFGINLLDGFTSCQTLIKKDSLVNGSNGFYTLKKESSTFVKWLKPHTLFKILITSLNSDLEDIVSTLLYVDGDLNIVVVTKTVNRILKPFLYIWLLTHDLMYVTPYDHIEILSHQSNKQLDEYSKKKDLNDFITELQIVDEKDLTVLSDFHRFVYKVNLSNYLINSTDKINRWEQLKTLCGGNKSFISLKEMYKYSERLNIMYDQLKAAIRPKYKKFPLLDILKEFASNELRTFPSNNLKVKRKYH